MKITSILACALCLSSMIFSSCGGSNFAAYDNVDLIPVTTSKTGKWSMVVWRITPSVLAQVKAGRVESVLSVAAKDGIWNMNGRN